MDGRIDGWRDGRIEERKDGYKNGWRMDKGVHIFFHSDLEEDNEDQYDKCEKGSDENDDEGIWMMMIIQKGL